MRLFELPSLKCSLTASDVQHANEACFQYFILHSGGGGGGGGGGVVFLVTATKIRLLGLSFPMLLVIFVTVCVWLSLSYYKFIIQICIYLHSQ